MEKRNDQYRNSVYSILSILRKNATHEYVGYHPAEYNILHNAIELELSVACDKWQQKVLNPASVFELPDITKKLKDINRTIDKLNSDIKSYNDIIENRKKNQKKMYRNASSTYGLYLL